MRDRQLERRIGVLKGFIDLWVSFKTSVEEAIKKTDLTSADERAFLEVKSTIARRQQALIDVLGAEDVPDSEITAILAHAVSLKQLGGASGLLGRKLETDWHEAYMQFNRALGTLENDRDELARVNAFGRFFRGLLSSRMLWVFVVLALLIVFYMASIKRVPERGGSRRPAAAGRRTPRWGKDEAEPTGGVGTWLRENVWDRLFKSPGAGAPAGEAEE